MKKWKIILNSNMITHRNIYHDRDTFIQALAKYQGKLSPDKALVDDIIQLLDKYFASYSMDTGEKVRRKPLNKLGRKDSTSRELMYRALSDIQRPLYDYINYFCYVYWGWSLPDVSHLENQIISDYDKTQVILNTLQKDRKSSLNIQFRLRKHLELAGYTCSDAEFRPIKTRSILEDNNDLWRRMVEGACLTFIP